MERNEFYDVVLSLGEKYIEDEILKMGNLKLHSQGKNNDVVLWGLMVERDDKGPSPILYLEEFYEEYEEYRDLNEIMEKVSLVYERAWSEKPEKNHFDFTFEKVKEKIIFKVVNVEKNRYGLESLEYRDLGNELAMIFAIQVNDDSIVNVTKKLMEEFNYNCEDVYRCAMENTPRQFPAYFREMLDFLGEGELDIDEDPEYMLYILTNTEKLYGAGVVFYPDVLELVADRLGGDFYAIPSSVHEWIVFSEKNDMVSRDYHQMIEETNRNLVHKTEVLSDYLFKYDREAKEFFVVKDM